MDGYKKRRPPIDDRLIYVPLAGFEPTTRCLEGSCSIQLSHSGLILLQGGSNIDIYKNNVKRPQAQFFRKYTFNQHPLLGYTTRCSRVFFARF